MPQPIPIGETSLWTALRRAARLVCPRCGAGALYASFLRMHEACPECGFRYEREHGYFVGAIYLNYAVTVGLAMGLVLVLDWTIGLTLTQQLAIAVPMVTVLPVILFRWARALWLAVDHVLTRADVRQDRRRHGPG